MFGVWRWVSTQELCSGVGVIGLSLAHAASQDKGDLVKPSLWKKGVVPITVHFYHMLYAILTML
jgi:hypothetical protein